MCARLTVVVAVALSVAIPNSADAAGILTSRGAGHQPIQIRSHHANVTINNGFAMTEVTQTFYNPNDRTLEALYSFPVPKSASLSEVTIHIGEKEINGEVLPKGRARRIYEDEKSKGNETGLAEKDGYRTFEFSVSPVKAQSEVRIRFLYYQPLKVDTGVGRYVYPLQDGGTDDAALSFWATNKTVEDLFSVSVELKSAYPITNVRAPGFESVAVIEKKGEGHYALKIEQQKTSLNRDFVLYYKLAENLPGRVELIPYRADRGKPGTFMLVVTPGMDLAPLENGSDYTFVLDVSGSMSSKIHTLARGVGKAMGDMRDRDRFRIVTFNNDARELTRGMVSATEANVKESVRKVMNLKAGGSTNLYAGVQRALRGMDDDRVQSIVLVTDGVTNTGILDHASFEKLMKAYDVRVFGFLMGNSANWPLMRTLCDASGGFAASVSNNDDIVGQIMLAKSKILHECMHDAELKVSGVDIFDVTDSDIGKVYRGQQLVMFGRYAKGGEATVKFRGRITGEDKVYQTSFEFPEIDAAHPEVERLWALDRVEEIDAQANVGRMSRSEADDAIRDLGVGYQLVTDQTSMVVLSDEAFTERKIERRNQKRIAIERQARARRVQQPPRNYRVDKKKPMFKVRAPSIGGGGAFDPMTASIALGLAGAAFASMRRRKK